MWMGLRSRFGWLVGRSWWGLVGGVFVCGDDWGWLFVLWGLFVVVGLKSVYCLRLGPALWVFACVGVGVVAAELLGVMGGVERGRGGRLQKFSGLALAEV